MSLHFDHLPRGPVVLDASAIINLLGCGEIEAVLRALGEVAMVEERTLGEIQRHPIPGQAYGPVLEQLRKAKSLKLARMTAGEYEIFLSLVQGELASRLDGGECAAIALAVRGVPVVLDENKARRLVVKKFPNQSFCSTLKLLLTAGTRAAWPLESVQRLVLAARVHARMGVPREERVLLSELMADVDGWPAA